MTDAITTYQRAYDALRAARLLSPANLPETLQRHLALIEFGILHEKVFPRDVQFSAFDDLGTSPSETTPLTEEDIVRIIRKEADDRMIWQSDTDPDRQREILKEDWANFDRWRAEQSDV